VVLPESCLLTLNVNIKTTQLFLTSPVPKRYTYFTCVTTNIDSSGTEFRKYEKIESNDVIYKKRVARNKLLSIAQILEYSESKSKNQIEGKYKPFLITLTLPHQNRSIREFLNRYKIQLKRNGIDLLYYCWALEFGKNGKHPHYHIVIWVNNWSNVVQKVKRSKFECIYKGYSILFPHWYGWVGRTEVSPIKKSVYRYLTKYFTKEVNYIRSNGRNYGYGKLSCYRQC
jgi:hypothetical protein